MDYRLCTNCIMDTSDPDITFNEKGVCNHCLEYFSKENERRVAKQDFPWTIAQIKKDGLGKKYDCLLGLSGGVDSSTCLHYLKEHGLRPLCFSVDNGWNMKEADENIMCLVEGMKVPFFRYTIDLPKFQKLQKAFIESGTPNIEIPTDHILMATTYELAAKYKIKWIISGGNYQTESVMPKAWGYSARDLRFIKTVYKLTGDSFQGLPSISLLTYLRMRFVKGIKIVNLLDHYNYNREESIQLLKEKYGYKPYGEKHGESKFTKWFQESYLPKYFGYDKRRAHYSSLILSKQMTRSEALKKIAEPLLELPSPIPFTFKEKKTHKDYKNNEFWWDTLSKIYARIK